MSFDQHIEEIDSEGNEITYFARDYEVGDEITVYEHGSGSGEEVTYVVKEDRLPQADYWGWEGLQKYWEEVDRRQVSPRW
jgi:hypothetical protein